MKSVVLIFQAMPPITTHVLDTAKGIPAVGMRITLDRECGEPNSLIVPTLTWERIGETTTNSDGRGPQLSESLILESGMYRTIFYTQDYFERQGTPTFYPYVELIFRIVDPSQHYHIPLLISPYGFSTYRGS